MPHLSLTEAARRLGLKKSGSRYVGACPACSYKDSFILEDSLDHRLAYCHCCRDQDAVVEALRRMGIWNRNHSPSTNWQQTKQKERAAGRSDRKIEYAKFLWHQSLPVSGTPAETYLTLRGISPPIPSSLRFLPRLKHTPTRTCHPAMVSAVMRWPGDDVIAVHRTYLAQFGAGKAQVEPQKMTIGAVAGGAVRLAPAGDTLVVSEGIETALSVLSATGIPTWAALSAGGIKGLVLPTLPLASEVIIAADNDPVGLEAAHNAAQKWRREGRRIRIACPPQGLDFNDLLMDRTPRPEVIRA